ncbi:hypothetical protein Q8F55_000525 [Vanrija albida]|uniref:PWWP domain-containing protein n=1 Tax=Vanrija albida TaxID=181172 RepID=A0ABR3QE47_9TREE
MSEDAAVLITEDVSLAADKPKSKAVKGGKAGKKAQPGADATFTYGEIVLARLRGYPAWPARITNPDDLPANVLAQRPKSSQVYCTQFFPVGDFSWLPPKDVQSLPKHQIEAFLNETHRKASGALREAYKTALDPTEWDAQQADKRRALEEEVDADDDVDELEEEGDEPKGKRKRASAPVKKDSKKAKTAKKAAAEEKPKAKAEKPKAQKKESGSEPAPNADDSASPQSVKVRDWRHKLQRAFLSKDKPLPAASEMDSWDELFKTIEEAADITVAAILYSKIDKVMKMIAALDGVARNEELKITERADKLYNDWTALRKTAESGAKPETNGNGSTEDKTADAQEASAPAAAEAPEAAAAAPEAADESKAEA